MAMTMPGSMSDNKFQRDSLLALMLWKLTIIARSLFLSNRCSWALFEDDCDDVCWDDLTLSGSESEAMEMCDESGGVSHLFSVLSISTSSKKLVLEFGSPH